MPSGGNTPISSLDNDQRNDWVYVKDVYKSAVKFGLEYEWLDYFIGGLLINDKTLKEAANDAAIEWDF